MPPLRPRIVLLGLAALALPVMLALITYVLAGRSFGADVGVSPQGPAGPVATVVTTTTTAPTTTVAPEEEEEGEEGGVEEPEGDDDGGGRGRGRNRGRGHGGDD
jgi:hypothetical protein